MSDAPPSPVQRPKRRWWVRILRWACLLLLLLTAAGAGGLWWIWNHQTQVVRYVLGRMPLPVEVRLEQFKADRERITITDLRVKDRQSGRQWIQAAQITWRPVWSGIGQGQFGSLEISRPVVHLSGKDLAPFLASSAPTTPTASRPLKFRSVVINDGMVELTGGAELPSLSLTFDHEAEDLDLSRPSNPHIRQFSMTLRDVVLENGACKIPRLSLFGSLTQPDGMLRITEAVVERPQLHPEPSLIKKLEPWLKPTPSVTSSPGPVKAVELNSLQLTEGSIDTQSMPDLPKAQGRVSLLAEGVVWSQTGALRMGRQTLELSDARLKPPSGSGSIQLPALKLQIAGTTPDKLLHIAKAELQRPMVEWTADLERWMRSPAQPATLPPQSKSEPLIVGVMVDSVMLDAGVLHLTRTPMLPYAGRATLALQGEALRIAATGLHSDKTQHIRLSDINLAEHPTDRESPMDTLLAAKNGEVSIVPDDWFNDQRIQRLVVDAPKLVLLPENTTFQKQAATPSTAPAAAVPDSPLWQKIKFDHLSLTNGTVNYSTHLSHRVDVTTALDIRTEGYKSVGGNPYQTITLKKIRMKAPELAAAPITNVEELSATVEWPAVWKTERIESLRMRGGELDVNDVVKQLTGANPSTNAANNPPSPPPPMPPAKDNGWRINRLVIADTYVTLHRLTPGLPPVKFAVNYDMWDMPLQPKNLIGRLEPQKIELSYLSLRSPFDPLREVAVMNTIFIHFTLDGLLAGRIDRVEVLNPTLNVGEDLFWYVDYYRKYAAGELPADEPAPRIVSSDDNFAFQAAANIDIAPPGNGGWTLEELAVTGGKLVIAPKGIPLPGIPRPFPFSFVTKLENGQFEAELEIPSDTYTWENLKLEFQNLRGHVLFNLPHKQVNNNLTETFRVDVIRWKQLHMEECFLTVTYDAAGIYGQFGGKAYEGYVKGAFNIYNDTTFSWDGWITGTGVRTTEITQKLTPTYLLLDGRVDASVIAQGNMSEVYQTDLSFTNTEPGKFSITTLNNAIDSIPTDIEGYLQDITRIGIETVRDFDYDRAEAKARFYGREGRGHLLLSGPYGTRNIDVNVYDHRWKVNKKKPASSATLNASE